MPRARCSLKPNTTPHLDCASTFECHVPTSEPCLPSNLQDLVGAAVHEHAQRHCELSDKVVARPPVLCPALSQRRRTTLHTPVLPYSTSRTLLYSISVALPNSLSTALPDYLSTAPTHSLSTALTHSLSTAPTDYLSLEHTPSLAVPHRTHTRSEPRYHASPGTLSHRRGDWDTHRSSLLHTGTQRKRKRRRQKQRSRQRQRQRQRNKHKNKRRQTHKQARPRGSDLVPDLDAERGVGGVEVDEASAGVPEAALQPQLQVLVPVRVQRPLHCPTRCARVLSVRAVGPDPRRREPTLPPQRRC
eukprot:3170898-Rhodomonas_salina.3